MQLLEQFLTKYAFKRRITFNTHSKRHLSVRVRFAPSPTGFLHLGGLRTALYNHLFAISSKGKTILRIEDTDQDRKVEGAASQLVEDLAWCGLRYDEGPIFQSERLSLYNRHINILLESGHAYKCFCTSSRLDLLRRESVKLGLVPKYDNRCRFFNEEEVGAKLENGLQYCVRFKLTPSNAPFRDLVYGEIEHDVASIEGDPVMIKTDGFPTYHFANVVDDHDMEITHVLRGVEWQGSTQKHLLLYRAFGWDPPQFAHLPLLLNPDGSKLSKRQGDVHVQHYRESGIFPEALLNFIVRAGGGFDIEQWQRDTRSFTLQELAEKFDLNKMNGSSCKVSLDKLPHSNRLELKRKMEDPASRNVLIENVQALVKETFSKSGHSTSINTSKEHVRKILEWAQNRIFFLHELVQSDWAFLWSLPQPEPLDQNEVEAIKQLLMSLQNSNFAKDELNVACKSCAKSTGIKFPKFMKLLRKIISGLQEGPAVAEMMEVLGRDAVLERLHASQSWTSKDR